MEITPRIKAIQNIFNKENEFLLKDLASASIHLAFFIREILNNSNGDKTESSDIEAKFLDECGCKGRIRELQ